MSAKTFLIGFTIDGESTASDGLIDAEAAPSLLVIADEFLGLKFCRPCLAQRPPSTELFYFTLHGSGYLAVLLFV